MEFDGFDWNDSNRNKCLEHGVSIAEIEALFVDGTRVGPDIRHSSHERRFRAVGKTAHGRSLFVVFTWRQGVGADKLIRPISARYMHKREIEAYEKSFP